MTFEEILPHTPGHVVSVRGVGWGEPKTIYTQCTCGWNGTTIQEPGWLADDTGHDGYSHYVEPYRSIMRTYGPDAILADGYAYGSNTDALKQALVHLGYDPDTDRKKVIADLTDAADMLRATISAPHLPGKALTAVKRTSARMRTVLTELDRAVHRFDVWDNGTTPTAAKRHPEAIRIIAEHEANRAATINNPLTDDEREALAEAGINLNPAGEDPERPTR